MHPKIYNVVHSVGTLNEKKENWVFIVSTLLIPQHSSQSCNINTKTKESVYERLRKLGQDSRHMTKKETRPMSGV